MALQVKNKSIDCLKQVSRTQKEYKHIKIVKHKPAHKVKYKQCQLTMSWLQIHVSIFFFFFLPLICLIGLVFLMVWLTKCNQAFPSIHWIFELTTTLFDLSNQVLSTATDLLPTCFCLSLFSGQWEKAADWGMLTQFWLKGNSETPQHRWKAFINGAIKMISQ